MPLQIESRTKSTPGFAGRTRSCAFSRPLLAGSLVLEQTNTGEITRIVGDSQGGVLPGATVVAEHIEASARIECITDAEGRCFLPSFRVGTCMITAELPGIQRVCVSHEKVVVQLGQTIRLDFALPIAGLTESPSKRQKSGFHGECQTGRRVGTSIDKMISNPVSRVSRVTVPSSRRVRGGLKTFANVSVGSTLNSGPQRRR